MEKKRKSNVNNQTLFNISSTVILSGINFLTIPIFTRMLGADNYGQYSIFHSWVIILTCFMGLETGTTGGTARYMFPKEHQSYLSSSLFLGTISSGVFILIGVAFRDFWAGLLGYPPTVVVLMLLCAFGNFVVGFAKSVFIYNKQAHINFVVSISLSILTVVLSIILIPKFSEDNRYMARVLGDSIPYSVVAIVLWFDIFTKKPTAYNKRYWTYCLTMCLPMIFHVLANDVLKQSDKVMLRYMGFAGATVGIYSFQCTYTNIVQILLTALNTSWCPFYYDDLNAQAYERLDRKCKNYLELFTVLACGFLLVSREVSYIFANEEYRAGIGLIPILVLGIYFIFLYQFSVNFEFYNKKTKIIAAGTICAAVGNIVLNLLLIPKFGMYGAAIATATAYGLLFIAHYNIASRLKEMKFHLTLRQFIPGLVCVLLCMGIFYLLSGQWYIRWFAGIALGVFELMRIFKRKSIF